MEYSTFDFDFIIGQEQGIGVERPKEDTTPASQDQPSKLVYMNTGAQIVPKCLQRQCIAQGVDWWLIVQGR